MNIDLIIKSNAIFDSVGDKPFGGYVAIDKGELVDVGRGEPDVEKYTPAGTVDYGDNLIIPSFHESHAHVFYGALELDSQNVVMSRSEDEAAKMIYDFEAKRGARGDNGIDHSDDGGTGWVFGFGWNNHYWEDTALPTRASLDRYFPATPVAIINEEVHGLWVNSKALEIAGIDRATEIPLGVGEITRDENGEPTGHLLETYAMKLVLDRAFEMSPERESALISNYFRATAKMGITAISNLQIHEILKEDLFERMERDGTLGARIGLVASVNEDIDVLETMQNKYHSDKLFFSGVKGFIDGTPMGYTGLMVEEYSDRPGFLGECYMDCSTYGDRAREWAKRGIRMRLHACGDGAVRTALDLIDHANSAGTSELRHTIEHIEVIEPSDITRFAESGVIASVQPDHMWSLIFAEHPFHEILGPDRMKFAYPFKSLQDAGVILAFGSDNPIAELEPMKGIYRAVTRLSEDKEPIGGWTPTEKLSVAEALKAYTWGSSYQMHLEKLTGTLEKGKRADIAVLDTNLFDCDSEAILETKVVATYLDGEKIY